MGALYEPHSCLHDLIKGGRGPTDNQHLWVSAASPPLPPSSLSSLSSIFSQAAKTTFQELS